jgi:hypothetical protein
MANSRGLKVEVHPLGVIAYQNDVAVNYASFADFEWAASALTDMQVLATEAVFAWLDNTFTLAEGETVNLYDPHGYLTPLAADELQPSSS